MPEPKQQLPRYAVGADIGGTHITSALVDLEKKEILPGSDFHQKVDAAGWPSKVIPTWGDILKKSMEVVPSEHLAGVGLAIPGPFDYENGISQITGLTKYERLFGLNVKHALGQYLGLDMERIRLMNDANCFLYGESWITKKDYQRVIGITLGTGFGAAFLSDAQIVQSGPGVPPNAEFFPIPFRGETAEDYISSRGILRLYKKETGIQLGGVKDVATRAGEGELFALTVLKEFGDTLGAFIGSWLKDFGAEALIIGGNISRAHSYFLSALEASLLKQGVDVDLIISQLLDQAGILGAGRLFAPVLTKESTADQAEGPSRRFAFKKDSGIEIDGLKELWTALADEKKVVLSGRENLDWGQLRGQLAETSPYSTIKIYETTPNGQGNIPGYSLAKILNDPTNEFCLLLGYEAEKVHWDAPHFIVSEL